ncbi:MAG: cation transporter [Deltaproteobacteria bacterium]|nr:cation transporter [Deltaproteobacteria bacterium]
MKVQVFYFTGCPNREATTELVREVAREPRLSVDVEEVEVMSAEDAARLRFLGSPSVHVNGLDIEPSARNSEAYAFACRTYNGQGAPPRELLVAALKESESCCAAPVTSGVPAAGTPRGRPGLLMGAAGLFAVLASACCIGPLVLTVFGISTLGASTAFEPLRPVFLGVTALLLGGAFYLTHVRTPACAPGSVCATPQSKLPRLNRNLLWVAAVAVGAIAVFPSLVGPLLGGSQISVAAAGPSTTVALHIDGMSCPMCVGHIKTALEEVPGVQRAAVSYENQRAEVVVDGAPPPSTDTLVTAVENAGYHAKAERNR